MPLIDALFQTLIDENGSDLHLAQGQPPKLRKHGNIRKINNEVLTEEKITLLLSEIAKTDRWEHFLESGDLDFAYSLGEEARFRCNYYRHSNGVGGIFRIIPRDILSIEELNLPQVLTTFGEFNKGMVLVTGPTGSGKSTTLAAIIDHINSNTARHILTIEEPIEFVHTNKKSIIVQREVGIDTGSFGEALLDAGHADCDVILVGEMRDLETISLAISAAEAGNLVFGTLHTNSAAKTIDRIIDVFPPDQQPQIRTMLSDSLKGVCSQLLLKRKTGGRIAANEILLQTMAVSNIIRDGGGSLNKLHSVMMGGRSVGMQMMDDVIEKYYHDDLITGYEAYMKALDKERFERYRDETE
ncbi:TPA: type IV pili twitching motility protein PilT [Candidatus Sumerlaeota bacterium]|nr:type IV pili twitching motility protein PilT [Candidatus Sumerlaeota bacterium]